MMLLMGWMWMEEKSREVIVFFYEMSVPVREEMASLLNQYENSRRDREK